MLIRIFSPLFTAKPHKFRPHGSTRTFPLFSSVAHTPTGGVGASTGAAATAGCVGATAATAAGAGAAGATSLVTAGAGGVDATAVEADGALFTAGAEGCGTTA